MSGPSTKPGRAGRDGHPPMPRNSRIPFYQERKADVTDESQDFLEAQLNPPGRKVHLELPVLDGHDAIRFVGLLSQIINAVWATYYLEIDEILREGDPIRRRFLLKGSDLVGASDFPMLPTDDDDLPF